MQLQTDAHRHTQGWALMCLLVPRSNLLHTFMEQRDCFSKELACCNSDLHVRQLGVAQILQGPSISRDEDYDL